MTQFRVAKPNQEVRLRKWEPGRIAQLKLFLGHLEEAVNTALASQVAQSPSREFSEFVPKIVAQDVTIESEFREIRVKFETPRGLRKFLFYEAQLSTNSNFAQFTNFTSPITSFVFTDLQDDFTAFIRIRVVTTDGLVGPWSDTVSATTPKAQAFSIYDGTEIVFLLPENTHDFTEVFSKDYTAIGGNVYYSIQYEIFVTISGSSTSNLEWADVELQWEVDGDQVGQNFLVTSYATNSTLNLSPNPDSDMHAYTDDIGAAGMDGIILPGRFTTKRRGSFVQKFTQLTEGDHTIKINARVLPARPEAPNDWKFDSDFTRRVQGARTTILLKNFNLFEALVDND